MLYGVFVVCLAERERIGERSALDRSFSRVKDLGCADGSMWDNVNFIVLRSEKSGGCGYCHEVSVGK